MRTPHRRQPNSNPLFTLFEVYTHSDGHIVAQGRVENLRPEAGPWYVQVHQALYLRDESQCLSDVWEECFDKTVSLAEVSADGYFAIYLTEADPARYQQVLAKGVLVDKRETPVAISNEFSHVF